MPAPGGVLNLLKSLASHNKGFRAAPSLIMGGIGAVTGFVGSGFSGWGALGGAALGLGAGSRKRPWGSETLFRKTASKGLQSLQAAGHAIESSHRIGAGMASALAARAGKGILQGAAIGFGVNALSGLSPSKINRLPFVGSPGDSYGSYGRSAYGTSFSGMGNGM
jgi:hypothetical protein